MEKKKYSNQIAEIHNQWMKAKQDRDEINKIESNAPAPEFSIKAIVSLCVIALILFSGYYLGSSIRCLRHEQQSLEKRKPSMQRIYTDINTGEPRVNREIESARAESEVMKPGNISQQESASSTKTQSPDCREDGQTGSQPGGLEEMKVDTATPQVEEGQGDLLI